MDLNKQTHTSLQRFSRALSLVVTASLAVPMIAVAQDDSGANVSRMRANALARREQRLAWRQVSHTAAPSASEQVAFPTFQYAVHPVDRIPNWGAMRTPAEWNRSYAEMMPGDFVPVPTYDLAVLTEPIAHLAAPPITADRYAAITAKLYYSTRHFGRYDIDAGEFTGSHSGIDFKLAPGTPIGAIGGGRVHRIGSDSSLGSFVMIEHHVQEEGTVFSIYGHLDEVTVREGQDVAPGTIIGTVGMTGNTSGPHLHLQIDRDTGARPHERFTESTVLSVAEAGRNTVHPMHFIERLLGRKVTLTR